MKRFKTVKIIAAVFAAILCAAACFALAACGEEEDTKYDVAIRVGCSDGEIYEFPVGEDKKHIEIAYDGTERTYWVESYNLPDHPEWSNIWFEPSFTGRNTFEVGILYGNEQSIANDSWLYVVDNVCERGTYSVSIEASEISTLWDYRRITLYIMIK